MRVLLFGGSGWIGSQLAYLFGDTCTVTNTRMESPTAEEVVKEVNPTHVVCCAGLTGRPNVDWCEDHKREVIKTNVVGVLNLADICHRRDIHLTYFGTGCIYDGYVKEYSEEDPPNFTGSYYSKTKVMVQELLKDYEKCLVLRLRMPITGDLKHPRNFITKIMGYERIVSTQNSMTVLPTLLPYAMDMVKRSLTGTYNFTNPGSMCHEEIMEMVKRHRIPELTWKVMTLEEQSKLLKAGRSNCILNADKLKSLYPSIPDLSSAIEEVFLNLGENS